ncbi:jg991, partial [Pararge aegeria aegeria]
MNGGVNGIMEESTELSHTDSPENSHTDSPDNSQTDKTNNKDDPSLNKLAHSNSESDNHRESGSEPIEKSDNTVEVASINGIVDHKPDEYTNQTSLVKEEDIDNTEETHCSTISNESCLGSVDSQVKTDSTQECLSELDPLKNCNDDTCDDKGIDSDDETSDESESSQNEEGPEESVQQKVEETVETVNIKSDSENDADDSSQESTSKNVAPLKEWPGGHNPNSNERSSPDVQVILSDNENSVIEVDSEPKPVKEDKPPLRRSSRAIKRKRYDVDIENGDNESDVEEVAMHDVKRRSKPIVINNTKTLVEMASKQMRSGTHKKENTVVILDTNREFSHRAPMMRKNPMALNNSSLSAQNLYQSILARGTTVTPVSNKIPAPTTHSSSSNAQPNILPSLTDDMFVVEAPSFIVPYVYEKPSVKPFREFVDELGKELDAQKAKEEELQKA